MTFDPETYGPNVAALLRDAPRNVLGPGTPNRVARPLLAALRPETLFRSPIVDSNAASACLAGLWLRHDFLDESHGLSQEIHTLEGSFWHAILHRREPDAWNSKYWWRKVGAHAVLARLVEEAPVLGYDFADPFGFVDFVERVRGSGTTGEALAERVQLLEWKLLFDWCCHRALSG